MSFFHSTVTIADIGTDNTAGLLSDSHTNVSILYVSGFFGTHDWETVLNLPRGLVDARLDHCLPRLENLPDDDFFVLIDRDEVDFDEFKATSETRTLKIIFPEDSASIEIIGTCLA